MLDSMGHERTAWKGGKLTTHGVMGMLDRMREPREAAGVREALLLGEELLLVPWLPADGRAKSLRKSWLFMENWAVRWWCRATKPIKQYRTGAQQMVSAWKVHLSNGGADGGGNTRS